MQDLYNQKHWFFFSNIYLYNIYLLRQIISEFWHYFPKICPLGLYVKYLYQMKVYTKHGLFTWYIWSIHIGLFYNHVLRVQILGFRKHQKQINSFDFLHYFSKSCPLGLYVKYLYQMWICAEGVSMLVVTNFQYK
jgi:hypothetical protein